ncbi:class F sortase [Skermania sp. ID1734]|uniref:class F sortase n=1 Tax=Skermania sp. ID1734 TaxID=2597516 RepID=UPI0011804344|nr:class F sortase [Skermania sp. ID1734]TSD94433.1 class F sortase [Skermania sp. ID1734]
MIRPLGATAAILVGAALLVGARSASTDNGGAPTVSPVQHPTTQQAASQVLDPPHPAVLSDRIPQADPIWISIEPGILDKTMMNPHGIKAIDGKVVPVDNRPVFRKDSNQPGTDSAGTSFIVGHNYVDASGVFVPFSRLEKVRPGNTVTVGTANGVLNYTVTQVLRVPKAQLASRTDLLKNVPGRLILETCDTTPQGHDTYDNLVVITALAS